MDFSNGVLSMCLLTFSTTVCVLGLILGVVFVLIHRQREEQLLDDIYHTHNVNTEGEIQQDESIPWGIIVFCIFFCLFFLLTILRWTDLQLSIFRGFINSGRWRAYFGMEVPRRHGQSNFKKVEFGEDAPLVKKVVKKVRFYDDTTTVEDIEGVKAKSNGVDCANQN
ncbi:hypothetical protein FOQG_07201 [Fusarium oxysporum f. sp. raphani 54005]|uniref:Uncharacterized protein n=1 Tax=Fusarium oxysporum f. sp. raphani 54005 TaxID=1089458 RepID=X0CGN2_FUSOX|nr:hypothetical protein FOQG_07201 [Fusarium oxysporum f. sp. raphani 54005]KAJ4052743.1 hypothetical protein NW753_006931 [Fusarium oxysporum]WKT50028.1 hypothetical protein QSH57_014976 [Fusarium oxysporum f. sp. vasinfectum]KAJ4054445.1 hypothetical protein NW763_008007 [Fusarium oxysporum]KAJ4115592.1 hypothetical protein NW769_004213 [Fusarium oxysporum]